MLRIKGWARDGLTDEQIASKIGIAARTFYEWLYRFPQIKQALKEGKAPVDTDVENTLLKTALGYSYTIKEPVKIKVEKMKPGIGRVVEEHVQMIEREIHVPPNVTAMIYWLKNRRPDRWRDRPMETINNNEPVRIEIDV